MSQKAKSILLQALPVTLATLLVMAIIYAWVEPTAPPPGGNVPAPLNVSAIAQTKLGALSLTALYDTNNPTYFIDPSGAISAILSGNVGIGTTTLGTNKLKVAGNTTIEGDLNVTKAIKMIGGSGSYFKLPYLTTTERNALSPETGMMIFNTDKNEVEVYVLTGWSVLETNLPLTWPGSMHTTGACRDAGGVVYQGASGTFCRMPRNSCPTDWAQAGNWQRYSTASWGGDVCGRFLSTGPTTWSASPAYQYWCCTVYRGAFGGCQNFPQYWHSTPNEGGEAGTTVNPTTNRVEIGCY